jgi:hypothetical protein
MGCRNLFVVLIGMSLAAGCGGSPSSPSSLPGSSSLAAESAVMSAMTQAMSQVAIVAATSGDASNTLTMPCASGGSIVITLNPLPPQQKNLYRSSSRTEFRDCRNQTTTLNGDPYLETSAEHSFPTSSGAGGDSISTLRTTGGLRIDSGGVQGRVQFNCTMTVSVQSVNGSTQSSVTWSGTTTFEQPLGSTPVVRPCGPA